MSAQTLNPDVQAAFTRLATASDRASPTVFAGRNAEIGLLDLAVDGTQRDEQGHTVTIQGVPGVGKTALANEYAIRLLTTSVDPERLVVPVTLDSSVLDSSPAAIVEEIDRGFREFYASDDIARRINRARATSGAAMALNTLFALFTKKNFDSFRSPARAPDSLPIALDSYAGFRLDKRECTIVLLVDEAQNLPDTPRVRRHLGVLHGGIRGSTKVLLACFGLQNTVEHLRELGLSRLAHGHKRTIGALTADEAARSVKGTIELAVANHAFDCGHSDEAERARWVDGVADVILDESANFPHHMANGCSALAEIVLSEGIGSIPASSLRERCRERKREYYRDRLRPWSRHTAALAHCFIQSAGDGWTPFKNVVDVLMASDDRGIPVDRNTALSVIDGLCESGFVENDMGNLRPALPSWASHFEDIRRSVGIRNEAVPEIQTVLSNRNKTAADLPD